MNLTDYKPGRRLDAMVAMCLGWRWSELCEHGNIAKWRFLQDKRLESLPSVKDLPLCESWEFDVPRYSTKFGAAAEAALKAGVLDEFSFCRLHYNGSSLLFDITQENKVQGESPAHCLCLGILALQPAEKLAEYESWLPEEVE